jgi:BirA family transcriptional regulator, biotin operon repressor / biotin---[acetyl-CoA-carboxylase] ligase
MRGIDSTHASCQSERATLNQHWTCPGEMKVSGFDVERFRQCLQTHMLGRECYYASTLASTNTTARALGQQGTAEGTIVFADAQSAGRGQAGRVWISPPERNIYLSVVLYPPLAPSQAPLLSLMAAVAVVDTLRQEGLTSGIKWPNDILIERRKVAGILTEMETHRDAVRFVVVGIGINVNMTQVEIARHLGAVAFTATSLQAALGRAVPRESLLATLLGRLEHWYDVFRTHGDLALQAAWEARSLMCGRRISARTSDITHEGTAEGIDPAGHLVLRQADGMLVMLSSAEVRFLD